MKIRETSLTGVLIIEPDIFHDDRGFFVETFSTRALAKSGIPSNFVQDNHSRSTRVSVSLRNLESFCETIGFFSGQSIPIDLSSQATPRSSVGS